MDEFDEIVREFLVESYENLDQLDRDLVALEQEPDAHPLLQSIFRTIHTIKGTSGFLAFGKLEVLTHAGEGLLARLRDGGLRLTQERTTGLLQLIDAVRAILASIEATGREDDRDYSDLVRLLTDLQTPIHDAEAAAVALAGQSRRPGRANAATRSAAAEAAAATNNVRAAPARRRAGKSVAQPARPVRRAAAPTSQSGTRNDDQDGGVAVGRHDVKPARPRLQRQFRQSRPGRRPPTFPCSASCSSNRRTSTRKTSPSRCSSSNSATTGPLARSWSITARQPRTRCVKRSRCRRSLRPTPGRAARSATPHCASTSTCSTR